MESNVNAVHREPWNKGKIVVQKAPFKVKDIWAGVEQASGEETTANATAVVNGTGTMAIRATRSRRSGFPRSH